MTKLEEVAQRLRAEKDRKTPAGSPYTDEHRATTITKPILFVQDLMLLSWWAIAEMDRQSQAEEAHP